jgi:sn-glycerol 3-phosphate transport system substrate-binding protein
MIGGLLVLLALPSVCSARSAGDTNGVITLKVFGSALSPSVSLASQTASQRVLHRFQELHPEIQLVSTEGLKIQGQGGDISALMQFAAEIAPDVVGVTFRNVDNYVRQGFLQPIDPFLKEVPAEELRERVPNAAWPAIRRAGPDGADHVWALPCDTRVMGIVFRRSLFKEVGIDPTRGPRDWREFEEYCRKIHAADKTKYGFAFDVGAEESMRLISFIWSAGGVDMVEIAPGQWRAAFDSPGVIEAMMFYYRLVKGGLVYRGSDWAVQWRRGKIAMDLQAFGDALVCDQDPVGFGAAPVPLGPTGQRRNELSCTMMGISARTKDPRTLRAAWEFIRFIDGPESRGIRVRAWLENGMVGKINPRILKQFGFEEYQQDVPPD